MNAHGRSMHAHSHRFEAIRDVLLCGVQGCESPATHYLVFTTLVGEQQQRRCLGCGCESARRIGLAEPQLGKSSKKRR